MVPPGLPADLYEVLACPACHGAVSVEGSTVRCGTCGVGYPSTPDGRLDLRLQRPTTVVVETTLGLPVDDSLSTVRLDPNPSPGVDLGTLDLPGNVSARFGSYLPKAPTPTSRVLDLGCGSGVDRPLLEHAGYRWYGVDYHDARAPMAADGQALPFQDETFDLVFSVAVFQCFSHPHLALREVARVLRPGGRVMASVAFLTPYIPLSQFHWSHVGVLNALRNAGLDVEVVLADRNWSLLEAGATIGLFPRMPTPLATVLVRPLAWLHRWWWRLGAWRSGRPLPEAERLLRNAADLEFVAVKPGAVEPGAR